MSALPPKADIAGHECHVRYVPKADIGCAGTPLPDGATGYPFSPNAAPFDATRWPFSDTALVSQTRGYSELVPYIDPQIREIASTDSDHQT